MSNPAFPADEWLHVDATGRQQGPHPADELIARYRRGELRADTVVWQNGMANFLPLSRAFGLHIATAATTAPATVDDAARWPASMPPPPTLPADPTAAAALTNPPPPGATPLPIAHQRSGIAYAGFWRRFSAIYIDYLLISLVTKVVLFPVMLVLGFGSAFVFRGSLFMNLGGGTLAIILLQAVYFAWMHSQRNQATLGKMLVGIKVCREDGGPISFPAGLGRCFWLILGVLPLGAGVLMAGFTDRKRALHDMKFRTVVVDRWAFTDHPEMQRYGLDTASKIIVALLVLSLLVVGVPLGLFVYAMQDYPGVF